VISFRHQKRRDNYRILRSKMYANVSLSLDTPYRRQKSVSNQCREDGGGKPVQITGPEYVPCILSFGNVRYNQVVICRVNGTSGQRPSCARRPLLCFLTFPPTQPTLSYCSKVYKQVIRFVATHSGRCDSMAVPSLGGPKKNFHRGPNSLSAALYFVVYCLHSLFFVLGSRVCQRLEVFATPHFEPRIHFTAVV